MLFTRGQIYNIVVNAQKDRYNVVQFKHKGFKKDEKVLAFTL